MSEFGCIYGKRKLKRFSIGARQVGLNVGLDEEKVECNRYLVVGMAVDGTVKAEVNNKMG